MGEVSYKPIIQDMTWSFSRVKTFDDCPYRWFLHYIRAYDDKDLFYASYGSFMHDLLARFYNGELTKQQMLIEFLTKFKTSVIGYRPQASTVQRYIDSGVKYITELEPFPYNTLSVEERMLFDVDGIPFVGVVDYIGELDGNLYLIDHKSRKLRQRSGRKKPTKKDEELDEMLKQLYIYSIPIEKKFGRLPSYLGFNCFRSGNLILEPFNHADFEKAKQWAKDTVLSIQDTEDFEPHQNSFSCFWICGVSSQCKYYIDAKDERT